jgi:soluble lytic murein transglycosylase-like protein
MWCRWLFLALPIVFGCQPPLERSARPIESASVPVTLDIPWMPRTVTRHKSLIEQASRRYQLDPALVAIVALVESGGWVRAKSPTGARGLMQLVPATAREIAEERAVASYDDEKLFDPSRNLDFGSFYLAQQLREFATPDREESIERAAAAYNGGPGRLRLHLEGRASLSAETQRYRHWVRGMWNERAEPRSNVFRAWLDAGGARLVARAEEEMASR